MCVFFVNNSEEIFEWFYCIIMVVMECIYIFFVKKLIVNSEVKKVLENIFFVLVEYGKKFILFC